MLLPTWETKLHNETISLRELFCSEIILITDVEKIQEKSTLIENNFDLFFFHAISKGGSKKKNTILRVVR